jgi:hypothetical protein
MKRILLTLAVVITLSLVGAASASAHDGYGGRGRGHSHYGPGQYGYGHAHVYRPSVYRMPSRAYYPSRAVVVPIYPAQPVHGYGYGYPYSPVYRSPNFIGVSGPRLSLGFSF